MHYYSLSQWILCISQIRNEILKTTCSNFTSSSHLCTSKKAFSHSFDQVALVHLAVFLLSVTIVMLLNIYYIVLCAIVLPLKTSSH